MSSAVAIRRGVLREQLLDAVEQPAEPATGLRRDGDDRRSLAEPLLEPRADVLDPDGRDVPLREDDERRAAGLAGDVGDGQILVDEPLARVDEDERDVRALRGRERAQLRVVLDLLAVAALAAQPGRVDEDEGRIAAASTVSIASRVVPGHLGDDHALLAEERVQQARLADVRTAEDRRRGSPPRRSRRAAAAARSSSSTIRSSRSPVP